MGCRWSHLEAEVGEHVAGPDVSVHPVLCVVAAAEELLADLTATKPHGENDETPSMMMMMRITMHNDDDDASCHVMGLIRGRQSPIRPPMGPVVAPEGAWEPLEGPVGWDGVAGGGRMSGPGRRRPGREQTWRR